MPISFPQLDLQLSDCFGVFIDDGVFGDVGSFLLFYFFGESGFLFLHFFIQEIDLLLSLFGDFVEGVVALCFFLQLL